MVLAGYAAALLVTCVVFYVYVYVSRNIGTQDSGGMQAFGDSLLFIGWFGFLALFPTALALYHLRSFEKFWTAFSIAALLVAMLGVVAAVMMGRPLHSSWEVLGFFRLLTVLVAPLFGLCFSICGVIAPTRQSRRLLITAAAIEFVVSAYVFLCLAVLGRWLY
jgi:hypothetical protein